MFGTILFSSKIRYGQNKRNIPYYMFKPDDNKQMYIVASKKGRTTKVDHYAKIEIIDYKSNPQKGGIQILFGEINNPNIYLKYSLHKYNILPTPTINIKLKNCNVSRLDLTK